LTFTAYQRGSTIIGIRRRSEYGVLEKILPVACKLLAANDPYGLNRVSTSMARNYNGIPFFDF
jgi:hypothetical protein